MSIVAVFLALGIGIVMGSGVLGGPILEGLERRADAVLNRNDSLREQIAELERDQEQMQDFASTVAPALVSGELLGREIVLIELDGTDGALIRSIENAVEEAGGAIPTRIVLSNRFALQEQSDREALSAVLESQAVESPDLRAEAGLEIGTTLGASAADRTTGGGGGIARGRAVDMLQALEEEDFISINRTEDLPLIPPEAIFVVAGGGESDASYATGELVVPLAGRVDVRGTEALVAESGTSTWGVVADVRDDPDVSDTVSTVDNGETVSGGVAIVLGLSSGRPVGHWGTDEGAEAIIPAPTG